MNQRTQDRSLAACGIGSVALMLTGVGIGASGGREFATISSTPAQIAHAAARPAGAAVWVGAYVELLSFGLFLAFAVWACSKLGGGLLGSIARAAATSYATLSIASLGVLNTLEYRAGHGIPLPLATSLVTLTEALFVGTWFLSAFFLVAAGPLALAAGRRVLGWGAIATAAIILVATAASLDNVGQMANSLWLLWIVCASVALARGTRAQASAPVALHA